jgi:hypothetical protein
MVIAVRSVLNAGDLLLKPVTKDFGYVQEYLGTDARIASLHARKEALIDHQYLHIFRRNHIGCAHVMTNQAHLAEHVTAIEFPHHP